MAQNMGLAGAATGAGAAGQVGQGAQASDHAGKRLGAFLCWAVVFADIGTSVYYTPGILFGQFHQLAGFFVILTLVAFVLLTLKYAEVSVRFPEGGGVVTVAARAINPWAGAVGGMFILVDYFLTSAISSLSGLQYFQNVAPAIGPIVLPATVVVVVALGVLNWWGIKESAVVSAAIAVAAFVSDIIIVALVFWYVPFGEILQVFRDMFSGPHLTGLTLLTGFAGAFLAFSGLESISQLSPVMRIPRRKTVTVALALVAITVGITSPLLTVFSTILLDPAHRHFVVHPIAHVDPNQFISLLGGAYGGLILEVATAVTASALLIFASNTAIIGAYHVFLALSRMGFFPKIVEARNKFRDTPHVAIILATGIPILVLIAVQGRIDTLGELYAFGLLGAFSLTCIGLDIVRYRERHGASHIGAIEDPELLGLPLHGPPTAPTRIANRTNSALAPTVGAPAVPSIPLGAEAKRTLWRRVWKGVDFYLGALTTVLVVIAWGTNLINKPLATLFGGGLTVLGLGVAVVNYRYQARKGTPVALAVGRLQRDPNSVLALLTPSREHNESVVLSAIRSAHGRPVIFAYIAEPQQQPPEVFEIDEVRDPRGRRALAAAAAAAAEARVTARFAYRVGTPAEVAQRMWNNLRSQEIITDAATARKISEGVRPESVVYQLVDGVRIAHYRRHSPGAQRDGQSAEIATWTPTASAMAARRVDAGAPAGGESAETSPTGIVLQSPPQAPTEGDSAGEPTSAPGAANAAAPGADVRTPRYPRRVDPNLAPPGKRPTRLNGATAARQTTANATPGAPDASDALVANNPARASAVGPTAASASANAGGSADAAPPDPATDEAAPANGASGRAPSVSRPTVPVVRRPVTPTKINRGNGTTGRSKSRSRA